MFLRLENVEPTETPFIAGQFISIYVGDGKYRAFSLCNAPSETTKLDLVAAVAHKGLAADYFKTLEIGEEVTYVGPAGRYKYSENPENSLVLIATGTGIAPFISILSKITTENPSKSVKLVWGMRNESELFFEKELEEIKKLLPNFEYTLYFSQVAADSEKAISGRVTKNLVALVEPNTEYHICGNPNMVEEVEATLQNLGVSKDEIFREKFTWAKT